MTVVEIHRESEPTQKRLFAQCQAVKTVHCGPMSHHDLPDADVAQDVVAHETHHRFLFGSCSLQMRCEPIHLGINVFALLQIQGFEALAYAAVE